MNLPRTYGWAQAVTPGGCGWTQASHRRQNPRQILQSPPTPPHETMSRDAHARACSGCRGLLGRCFYVRYHGGRQAASYSSPLAPGSPVPQCLSSPQAIRPPILLSPSRGTAHPGFPTLERRRSPWITVPMSAGTTVLSCLFFFYVTLVVQKNQCVNIGNQV